MSDLFARHADICKTFSNPKRLEIINLLRGKAEFSASQIMDKMEISKANLSQHMNVLVQKGVVKSSREGINVFYQLSDDRITKACDIMREVLLSKIKADSKILSISKTK